MANIEQTRIESGNTQTMITSWVGLRNGDEGTPVPFSQYADKSVQVFGDFGVGGNVRIEGSIDGSNYAPLTDPQGNDLDILSPKIEAISEVVRFIRPRVTAGDETTSINVYMLLKGAH